MSGECFIKMEYFYSILMEALVEKITGLEKELRETISSNFIKFIFPFFIK